MRVAGCVGLADVVGNYADLGQSSWRDVDDVSVVYSIANT